MRDMSCQGDFGRKRRLIPWDHGVYAECIGARHRGSSPTRARCCGLVSIASCGAWSVHALLPISGSLTVSGPIGLLWWRETSHTAPIAANLF